ncbi:MAG TPA: S53 family peptidase [Micromonosporaceae bacterium]|nr:S53 family peptidase [Micromonosporaceae bacterium]
MRAISRFRSRRTPIGVAVLATAGLVVGGVILTGPASATAGPTAHRITVHPEVFQAGAKAPDATFGCQNRPMDGSQGPRCYQPAQIQNAYNITPLLSSGINGAGRTIVIVDAYGSPTIATDLTTFDATMGLPDPSFTTITPAGSPPPFDVNDPNQFGWSVETTLDVEWAHVTAPGANIVLAVAASNNDTDILNTTKYVVDHNIGDVISQSFGEAEACMDSTLLDQQHAVFAEAVKKGITLFASSGDSGASQPSCDGTGALFSASTPASDPNVTAVGGTTLTADPTTGAYQSETAWTEPFGCNPPAVAATDVNCSGGGFSSVYKRPSYQAPLQKNHARGVPDVAYNAGVSGGVLIFSATINAAFGLPPNSLTFFIIGGTSAGSPQWAGLAADADQLAGHRLGNINDSLYKIAKSKKDSAALHDITTGNNDVAEIGGGFDAGTGWDAVTGVGTPNAAVLLPLLAK